VRPDRPREPLDATPQQSADDAEDDGPQEHRAGGLPEGGEIRDRERERPEPRQRVEADEHEFADACGQQPGEQDEPEHRPPDARHLQHQERAQQR
jgi:hypothetical protein